ncbi:MAG: YkvA family protein [Proteobacteria bacterium]|nr:YkvA family protein [Pseudomonadota bacterium]MDA1063297.1 YkvA family protein [Pseudomonadota bacterium]
MSLRISLVLDDDDLRHFRLIMRAACDAATHRSPEDIVAAAAELMRKTGGSNQSGFIAERLQKLELMMRMISDLDWRLPHADSKRVLHALAYFAEPDDLIPDDIPGLGFLDDAIMVELVVRELRHEIEAYQDFCVFRDSEQANAVAGSQKERRERLNSRRTSLQSRMHRRLQRDVADKPRFLD